MTDDQKQTLGEFLKSEREKRGLTIEQTSSATKIGLKILKLLEADRYSDLPALPFVRGFIRNYGKFLGLDGEKLLQEYASFLEEHSRERPKRDAGHSGYAFERPEGEQSRKILWGVMAGMLVFGGAVVFIFKPSLKRKHHSHIDKMKASPLPGEEGQESLDGMPSPLPSVSALPLPSGTPAPAVSGVIATPSASPSSAAPTSPAPSPSVAPKPSPTHEAPYVVPKVPLILNPNPPAKPSPAPTATPSHSPTHAVPAPSAAAPSPSASPTSVPSAAAPVPSASPSPQAAGAVEPGSDEDVKKDALQSGMNYATKEIKHRIIIRTLADVWVRYRCDGKRMMKFALKKDKILVLRGKENIWFQTSNADSVTYQVGSGGTINPLATSAARFDYQGNPTLAWPAQARETIETNFKVGPALPLTPGPAPSGSAE